MIDYQRAALDWEGKYQAARDENDRVEKAREKEIRERARAVELLLDLVWNTTSNEIDDPRWRAAKKWLESVNEWKRV